MKHASQGSKLGVEVLRALRDGHDPAEIWQSLGRCIGFPKATLLFAALCEQTGQLGHVVDGAASGIGTDAEDVLRVLRRLGPSARPSQGWKLSQQRVAQFADAVHRLSLELASLNRFTGSPLAMNVPGRVGRLRAYGNAIVAPLAAEFIKAVMP